MQSRLAVGTESQRPFPVTLIAIFQFLRALAILLIGLSMWVFPSFDLDSYMWIRAVAYLASRRPLPPAMIGPFVLPLVAVAIAWIGFGLWRMQKWARNTSMVASGATVALWTRYLLFSSMVGRSEIEVVGGYVPISNSALSVVYCLVLIDLLIFCCLAFYPDVGTAFENRKG